MTVPYALLGLLERSSRHGYDLKQAYDHRFAGTRPLRVGHVYRILAQLVRDGQVVEAGTEPGAGPERKRYAITEAGVTDLARWLAEPEQPQLQAVLFVKVVLALLSGRPADAYLDAQREVHLARMREITARRRGAVPPEALLADYELFHIEADLRWIEHAAQRLDTIAAGLS